MSDHHSVQGWSSFYPKFNTLEFISLYLELPVIVVMTLIWFAVRRARPVPVRSLTSQDAEAPSLDLAGSQKNSSTFGDFPNLTAVDLYDDEYIDAETDIEFDAQYKSRRSGKWRLLWKFYDSFV